MDVSLDNNDVYILSFQRDSVEMGEVSVSPDLRVEGFRVLTVPAPEQAVSEGYDSILITASEGDATYSLGHLLLVE